MECGVLDLNPVVGTVCHSHWPTQQFVLSGLVNDNYYIYPEYSSYNVNSEGIQATDPDT